LPSIGVADALLDERRELTEWISEPMYGDPAAAAKYWRYQKYDDCVLMSSADVVGQNDR
jgi:hypothetical protein